MPSWMLLQCMDSYEEARLPDRDVGGGSNMPRRDVPQHWVMAQYRFNRIGSKNRGAHEIFCLFFSFSNYLLYIGHGSSFKILGVYETSISTDIFCYCTRHRQRASNIPETQANTCSRLCCYYCEHGHVRSYILTVQYFPTLKVYVVNGYLREMRRLTHVAAFRRKSLKATKFELKSHVIVPE